jgi:hypothetical protein
MSTTLSPKIDHALSPGRAKTRGHLGLWRLLITEMPFPRSKALGERVDVGPRVGSAGCLRGDQAGGMNALRIELEALTRIAGAPFRPCFEGSRRRQAGGKL